MMTSHIITDYDSNRKFSETPFVIPQDFQCPFCPWVCKSKNGSTFSMHISRKHAKQLGRRENPYVCTMCSETFSARTHLNHHIANHHEMILLCCPLKDCGYQSKQKMTVITHYVVNHMREKMIECQKKEACTNCDKKNFNNYHIGVCMPDSPFVVPKKSPKQEEYSCIACDFQTQTKYHYKKHTETKKHIKKIAQNSLDSDILCVEC